MKTQTGLTIEQKGNRINIYTPEEIERGKIIENRKETILTALKISVVMTLVICFYIFLFVQYNA